LHLKHKNFTEPQAGLGGLWITNHLIGNNILSKEKKQLCLLGRQIRAPGWGELQALA
jgi:hypothetical protein